MKELLQKQSVICNAKAIPITRVNINKNNLNFVFNVYLKQFSFVHSKFMENTFIITKIVFFF
jgi:hypothetical protein